MKIFKNSILFYGLWFFCLSTESYSQTPGFFKDVFSDGGAYLTSSSSMDAADLLGLSVEYLFTSDSIQQNSVMVQSADDSNGHLLYPDGAPRFRMIYTNGGTAANHGRSLGESGRERIRTFYSNGGSYSGSCAGAFIASIHWDTVGSNPYYYHIWPGRTQSTGLVDAYTDHTIPPHSPLLLYYNFGNDMQIENVRHNGGCYANEEIDYPHETEVLLRYNYPGWDMHGKASVWAYKPDNQRGRIVVTGSHPESAPGGEILNLMQAILLYALDGVGSPVVKGELVNGEPRIMDLFAEDTTPEYTRIGDKQYHHFTLSLPPEVQNLQVSLAAEAGFDFNLYLNPGDFAFAPSAQFMSTSQGAQQVIDIAPEDSGRWYIGVECATTVDDYYYLYFGQTEVLNGVAYSITATWDTLGVTGTAAPDAMPPGFALYPNYPNPYNPRTLIKYEIPERTQVVLVVYDIQGRKIQTLVNDSQAAGHYEIQWNGTDNEGKLVSTGIYVCSLRAGTSAKTIKMLMIK